MANHERTKTKRNGWWYLGAAALFLLSKGKTVLGVLGKFGMPLLTMLASIGVYALIFPWGFAVGLVFMLLIHELGHVFAARRRGLPVSAPMFIPFLGALIQMKKHPRDAETEAYIALGGPVLGTIGAVVVFAVAIMMRPQWGQTAELLLVIANIGFFLNLINLLPIHPLDGGRIATAVTRWLWVVGLVGGLFVIIYLKSVLFFVVWVLFALDLYQKFVKKRRPGVQILGGKIKIPLMQLEQNGVMIPGEEHRRQLPFTTFSEIANREQKLTLWWPQLGVERIFALPQQGIVHRVETVRIEQDPGEQPHQLIVYISIQYEPFETDVYYDVSASVRWKYGIAYAGLALFLAGMMATVQSIGIVI